MRSLRDRSRGDAAAPQTPATPAAAPPTAAPSTNAAPASAPAAAVAPERRTTRVRAARDSVGNRYVVRPGDSLWAIAQRVLGNGASTDQVSAFVETLWQRNAARIGTANRDVLPAGITIIVPKERA